MGTPRVESRLLAELAASTHDQAWCVGPGGELLRHSHMIPRRSKSG